MRVATIGILVLSTSAPHATNAGEDQSARRGMLIWASRAMSTPS